jgi:ESCRT-II complex subunit VPS36
MKSHVKLMFTEYCCVLVQNKAKEMVVLAEKMRAKLLAAPNAQSSATEEEEFGSNQDMQDWMLSVGIVSPVTKETAGAQYHQQLSRQVLL